MASIASPTLPAKTSFCIPASKRRPIGTKESPATARTVFTEMTHRACTDYPTSPERHLQWSPAKGLGRAWLVPLVHLYDGGRKPARMGGFLLIS